ncbi:MAG TPA: hypothetical protein VFC07_10625, partial [Verrucomicrobiae bacterium]|nr:hypothetical protein [Verrucomicrobiae bacterium]
MNQQERAELEMLKKQQAALLEQLGSLGRQLADFEVRLNQSDSILAPPETIPTPVAGDETASEIAPSLPVPPLIQSTVSPAFPPAETDLHQAKPAPTLSASPLASVVQASSAAESEAPPVISWEKPDF